MDRVLKAFELRLQMLYACLKDSTGRSEPASGGVITGFVLASCGRLRWVVHCS